MKTPLPAQADEIVWIVWKDAMGDSTRTNFEALASVQLAINKNLGWIAHEDDERIVLANGLSSTHEVDHLTIPKSCIVERVAIVPAPVAAKAKRR